MDLRKKIVLSFTIICTAGLTQAMARSDAQILQSVNKITYADYGTMERYIGALPDGSKVGFIRIADSAGNNEYLLALADYALYNFLTPQSRQDAFNYLRDKYKQQQESTQVPQ